MSEIKSPPKTHGIGQGTSDRAVVGPLSYEGYPNYPVTQHNREPRSKGLRRLAVVALATAVTVGGGALVVREHPGGHKTNQHEAKGVPEKPVDVLNAIVVIKGSEIGTALRSSPVIKQDNNKEGTTSNSVIKLGPNKVLVGVRPLEVEGRDNTGWIGLWVKDEEGKLLNGDKPVYASVEKLDEQGLTSRISIKTDASGVPDMGVITVTPAVDRGMNSMAPVDASGNSFATAVIVDRDQVAKQVEDFRNLFKEVPKP